MKLAHFSGLALMLALPLANAQSSVPVPQSYGVAGMEKIGVETSLLTAMPPSSCAIGLQAKHLADGDMMKTGAAHRKGPGQRLHLSFTSPDSRNIASATVNVRGWDHAGVATTSAESPAEAVRTVTVGFPGVQGRTSSADVWVPGLNSVTSIDLLTITFTDGSTWAPAAGKTCRAYPDPLMLITQ